MTTTKDVFFPEGRIRWVPGTGPQIPEHQYWSIRLILKVIEGTSLVIQGCRFNPWWELRPHMHLGKKKPHTKHEIEAYVSKYSYSPKVDPRVHTKIPSPYRVIIHL